VTEAVEASRGLRNHVKEPEPKITATHENAPAFALAA